MIHLNHGLSSMLIPVVSENVLMKYLVILSQWKVSMFNIHFDYVFSLILNVSLNEVLVLHRIRHGLSCINQVQVLLLLHLSRHTHLLLLRWDIILLIINNILLISISISIITNDHLSIPLVRCHPLRFNCIVFFLLSICV